LLVLVFCVLGCASCASIAIDSSSLGEPVRMNESGEKPYTVVKSFEVNDKAGWFLFFPVNQPAGDNHGYIGWLLDQQIKQAGGDAVINVKVRAQSQFLDYLIWIVPGYNTRTVTITGDVIKYN
jgi:hypothetical protein